MASTKKEKVESKALVKGLFHIIGPDNAGKTTFALSSDENPGKICFLDGDGGKTKFFAEQMKLGTYVDLTLLGKDMDELAYHIMVLNQIAAIEDNKYNVIAFDNLNEFFKGGHSYVATNRNKFRKKWNPMGPIAGAQEWSELRQTHYPRIYTSLRDKADLVILCTPEKAQSDSGVKTGLMVPSADESLRLNADVVIRLARNTRDYGKHAPVGLVIKNTSVWSDGKLKKVLPDRMPECTWDQIKHYLENPVHDRALTDEETPDEFEMHLIMGTLNPEQRELYEHRKRVQLMQLEENMVNDIMDAYGKHKSVPEAMRNHAILNELQDAYPDLTTDKIEQVLEGIK
jgi:GTPase SAR1 family protein